MRIHEISKNINVSSRKILSKLAEMGIHAKSHMSKVDETTARNLTDLFQNDNNLSKDSKDRQGEFLSHHYPEGIIDNIKGLRNFTGHPGRFWPAFLEQASRLAEARTGILLVQGRDSESWKQLSIWPAKDSLISRSPELVSVIEGVAEAAGRDDCALDCESANGNTGHNLDVLGLRLEFHDTDRVYIGIFLIEAGDKGSIEQKVRFLKLVSDTPAVYQRGRTARQAMSDVVNFSEALDLMVLLNAEKKYMAAAMTFANEVASRYQCPRASLGWIDGGYIRLQAVSHMERFEKKMDVVQSLEAAMEEAFDQNEETLWPPGEGSTTVVRDHEAFSREQGVKYMISLPVRLDDEPVGVLTCERADEAFSEEEVSGLRVLCDQAARRLGDLKKYDRWFGARMASSLRTGASRLLGVEHTFAKCIGLAACFMLLFLIAGSLPYRVEAPFVLRSDDVRYLPAPFEGYIDEVYVRVGEGVDEGQLLLTLDTGDLLLEESAALANQIRYTREAEKARSENELAEMKIALALADQAKARLDLVRHHLSRAEVKAPFSGIVVEGDLKELQGAAVKKGDILFKVSRLEKMYTEIEVSERDIHELTVGNSGEMAFVSQPEIKFPIEVERINPVAVAKKDEGNVFLVRCFFPEGMAAWWRPGMSGVAKISAGKRNVLWILTHRTVDFFRIRLWW